MHLYGCCARLPRRNALYPQWRQKPEQSYRTLPWKRCKHTYDYSSCLAASGSWSLLCLRPCRPYGKSYRMECTYMVWCNIPLLHNCHSASNRQDNRKDLSLYGSRPHLYGPLCWYSYGYQGSCWRSLNDRTHPGDYA